MSCDRWLRSRQKARSLSPRAGPPSLSNPHSYLHSGSCGHTRRTLPPPQRLPLPQRRRTPHTQQGRPRHRIRPTRIDVRTTRTQSRRRLAMQPVLEVRVRRLTTPQQLRRLHHEPRDTERNNRPSPPQRDARPPASSTRPNPLRPSPTRHQTNPTPGQPIPTGGKHLTLWTRDSASRAAVIQPGPGRTQRPGRGAGQAETPSSARSSASANHRGASEPGKTTP